MDVALFYLYPMALTLLAASFGTIGWSALVSTGYDRLSRTALIEWLQIATGPARRVSMVIVGLQFVVTFAIAAVESSRPVPTPLPWVALTLAMVLCHAVIVVLAVRPVARDVRHCNTASPPRALAELRARWSRLMRLRAVVVVTSFLPMLSAAFLYAAGL
jgi:hypothetical protein